VNPDQWYIDGCLKASPEDVALFNKWTAYLPKREESTPYHSGAHSIKQFRHALEIGGGDLCDVNVLEIGFCLGHSAEIFYGLGVWSVCSIENSDRDETLRAARTVKARHPNFTLAMPWEKDVLRGRSFELGFIDGDHSAEAIREDYALMRELRVPWVLFDDFWPHWGDTQQVMQELGITPVAILGTMALCDFR
jgi:hypothetical protein